MVIRNIIIGWWRLLTNKRPKWAKERYKICKTCIYNDEGWCGLCGCQCKAKSLVKEERCLMDKWPNDNE